MAMMLLLLASLLLLTCGTLSNPTCKPFDEWKPWTECLWFPVQKMHDNMTKACGLHVHRDLSEIELPKELKNLERCGHCSFKTRCRKRDKTAGCAPFDLEHEVCHDYSDICTMPKLPHMGCGHNIWREKLSQCLNRADVTDSLRKGYSKIMDALPITHCIEKDGQCKCCCGEYEPNESGTECVRPPDPQCPAFGEPTGWSECLWFPFKEMVDNTIAHCKVEKKPDDYQLEYKAPEGIQIPDRCGYCSFKVSCETRERKDNCFPLRVEKRNCGPKDCATCGDVCAVDKINGSCEWTQHVTRTIFRDFHEKSKETSMPHWKVDGYMDVIKNLPYGTCKEFGDKCKCCCHPYEPSEDGSSCVIKHYCQTKSELKTAHESSSSESSESKDKGHKHHHEHKEEEAKKE